MSSLHERAAAVLGWTVAQAMSMSLPALRENVRAVDATLADEISDTIRRGDYIRGAPYVGARKVVTYVYRGRVERGVGNGRYADRDGYSETGPGGGVTYPWMTYRECQADARARGAVARFTRKS
jgi:hypothetical protein